MWKNENLRFKVTEIWLRHLGEKGPFTRVSGAYDAFKRLRAHLEFFQIVKPVQIAQSHPTSTKVRTYWRMP